jgi:hypothetical protein
MTVINHETFGLPDTVVAKAMFYQNINDLIDHLENDGVDVAAMTRSEIIEKVREWAVEVISDDLYNRVSVYDVETGEDLIWGDDE